MDPPAIRGIFQADSTTASKGNSMKLFQLYSVTKSGNRIIRAIGDPDTYERCHNFKRAYDGTYQPVAWFTVQEAGSQTPNEKLLGVK